VFFRRTLGKVLQRLARRVLHRRRRRAYRGKIDVDRLPQIVTELRKRNQAITTSAISAAFGLERTAFHHAMRKHPELKAAFKKAVGGTR
jgi:hypothetical protein